MRISQERRKRKDVLSPFAFCHGLGIGATLEISFKKVLHLCSNAGSYLSCGQDNSPSPWQAEAKVHEKKRFSAIALLWKVTCPNSSHFSGVRLWSDIATRNRASSTTFYIPYWRYRSQLLPGLLTGRQKRLCRRLVHDRRFRASSGWQPCDSASAQ